MTTYIKTIGLLPRVEVEFGKLTRERMTPVISQRLREASPVRYVRVCLMQCTLEEVVPTVSILVFVCILGKVDQYFYL